MTNPMLLHRPLKSTYSVAPSDGLLIGEHDEPPPSTDRTSGDDALQVVACWSCARAVRVCAADYYLAVSAALPASIAAWPATPGCGLIPPRWAWPKTAAQDYWCAHSDDGFSECQRQRWVSRTLVTRQLLAVHSQRRWHASGIADLCLTDGWVGS
jgi:hypothetical protein